MVFVEERKRGLFVRIVIWVEGIYVVYFFEVDIGED